MNRIAIQDRAMQAQLDRLVGGDLPESERGNLLAWLDEDAARWRACGLAFLEAQLWEEAAAAESTSTVAAPLEPIELKRAASRREGPRVSLLALSAAVSLALAAGFVLARWLPAGTGPAPQIVEHSAPRDVPAKQPLIATVPVRTNLDTGPLLLQVPVSADPDATFAAEASLSDYERQQWERRGFEVIEELRYLPARLPDGRTVMVPVNKVQLKFKGTPVS